MKLYLPKTYDLSELARANLHTHTNFSGCAKPEMTVPAMIERAKSLGLSRLAFTDHFHDDTGDENYLAYVAKIKEQAALIPDAPELLFGAELSAIGVGCRLEAPETSAAMDYRLYSTNHFHCHYWHQPGEKTARGYAELMLDIVRELALSGMADCIAHPLVGRYVHAVADRSEVSAAITDNELGDILTHMRNCDVAYEINYSAVFRFPEFARRWWPIGKEVGVTFTIGTDAHTLDGLDTFGPLDDLRRALGDI